MSDGLKVSFDAVRSDSRCPMDVYCVWAGDAVIVVRLSQTGTGEIERELHTDPAGAGTSDALHVIKLLMLSPYPRSGSQIRPDEYVATLTVIAR